MRIRDVQMTVPKGHVAMAMAVRLIGCDPFIVVMLVMVVMDVQVLVFQRLVGVGVVVAVAKQKHEAEPHETEGCGVEPTELIPQQNERAQYAKDWGCREERCLPRRADQAQRVGVQDHAEAVA